MYLLLAKSLLNVNIFLTDDDLGAWPGEMHAHAPTCPRSNLPDLVATQRTRLTVENVRHHDHIMDIDPRSKLTKTGILKYGKLWKNGENKKQVELNESEESLRRTVRFSGRDEFTILESATLEDEHAALTRLITPKLRELGMLLGKDPWQLDLGSTAPEHHHRDFDIPEPPPEPKSQPFDPSLLEDEHIGESMLRYEEMRRRLAAGEGREVSNESSDESKSSSDSHSSDSTTTESRIRRLENADIAQVAGGILRSNSEVRRAIEQNALRRSLMKFPVPCKKDTNKNERSERRESSILEKLKWLTASEDLTNGNSDSKNDENDELEDEKGENVADGTMSQDKLVPSLNSKRVGSITQYRQLAEMFNQSTAVRSEMKVPVDIREWKLETDLFPSELIELDGVENEMTSTSITYTAVPAVSVCDPGSDEENDKLLYSGGVRYTREGTLMPPRRKELSVNKLLGKGRYTLNDIDEALHDDRSSSVPSSSQSSPRLSGRSDVDGASTTESGYSSNETNGEQNSSAIDELAEFVRQDASRMERLRMRYNDGDDQDHGFGRRPAVKGIKPKFGSTTELLQHMANQIAPNKIPVTIHNNSHMTWPYREPGQDNTLTNQRQRVNPRSVLPSVQEDSVYHIVDACIDNGSCMQETCCHEDHGFTGNGPYSSQPNFHSQLAMACTTVNQLDPYNVRHSRIADPYLSGQINQYANQQNVPVTEELGGQQIRTGQQVPAIPPPPHYGSTQSLQSGIARHHHPTCIARRPNSLHEQILDEQAGKQSRPTNLGGRPHSSLGQYSGDRYPDEALQSQGNQHQPLSARGSLPVTSTNIHSVNSPTQPTDHPGSIRHNIAYQHASQCAALNKGTYLHSPQELPSPNSGSPVGSGGISLMGCYPRSQPQQRLPVAQQHARCYPPQWHPMAGGTVPVSSHLSYTTPLIPDNTSGTQSKILMDVSKIDLLRDERGVPEGASSSPRSSYDAQYHGSPTRDQTLMLRHAQPLDISS